MHPRTQRALEALPPDERAAAEVAITQSAARRATPAGHAEEEEVIRKVREEFPPNDRPGAGQGTVRACAERERQGLSLSDISERTGIDRATLSMLETGKVTNPTVGTLRTLARALNKQLSWSLVDEPASAGR